MTESLPHEPPVRAWRLRPLAKRAREAGIGGAVLSGSGFAVCVLAGALLLWGGIVTGAPRAILLLLAAAILGVRLLLGRMSALVPKDAETETTVSSTRRRWAEVWQEAALSIAAGLCAYGSRSVLGAPVGIVAAALILWAAWRSPDHAADGRQQRDPAWMLIVMCLASVIEPLWGWRGQTFVIGLCLIAAAQAYAVIRSRWPAAR